MNLPKYYALFNLEDGNMTQRVSVYNMDSKYCEHTTLSGLIDRLRHGGNNFYNVKLEDDKVVLSDNESRLVDIFNCHFEGFLHRLVDWFPEISISKEEPYTAYGFSEILNEMNKGKKEVEFNDLDDYVQMRVKLNMPDGNWVYIGLCLKHSGYSLYLTSRNDERWNIKPKYLELNDMPTISSCYRVIYSYTLRMFGAEFNDIDLEEANF